MKTHYYIEERTPNVNRIPVQLIEIAVGIGIQVNGTIVARLRHDGELELPRLPDVEGDRCGIKLDGSSAIYTRIEANS